MSITISTNLIVGVLVILLIGYISKNIFRLIEMDLSNIKIDKPKKDKKEKAEIQKKLEDTAELGLFDIKEIKDLGGIND